MKLLIAPLPSILRSQHLRLKKHQMNSMSSLCRLREDALEICRNAVKSVLPQRLVQDACRRVPSGVEIQGRLFPLNHNVHVAGFGKAVLGMASGVEELLGEHIVTGVISVPRGIQQQMSSKPDMLLKPGSKIQVFEGAANNLPDEDSQKAAENIARVASSLKDTDLLLVLISGGGSALLPSPIPPLSLAEKQTVVKMLAESGATIQEMNIVRKRLSLLKGGGLARLAKPAHVVSLILSDIIGDPLDLIASGSTVKNTDDPSLALLVLEKFNLVNEVPRSVIQVLREAPRYSVDDDTSHVFNVLVGNNAKAADAAYETASQLGYIPVIVTLSLQGVAKLVGSQMARLALSLSRGDIEQANVACRNLEIPNKAAEKIQEAYRDSINKGKGLCIISAGETVVAVRGHGVGGRNQELALSASIELNSENVVPLVLLSAGTDGVDGPTSAAGAIAASALVKIAEGNGLNALQSLEDNDSYNFFAKVDDGKWHVITGHTGTNVMDLVIILIDRNN